MEEIKKQALLRALAMLKAAGCKYIVVDPDDAQHVEGDLKLAPPEPERGRKHKTHRPHGALVNYYKPLIENMQVSDYVQVPFGVFENEKNELAGAISAWCATHWGPKTAMTHVTETAVEILRLA